MSRFPPELSVLRTVKMTRTAYAQLVGQKFHPPKIFGKPTAKEGTDAWRWQDVGMKVVSLSLSGSKAIFSLEPRHVALRCCIKKVKVEQMYQATRLRR